MIEALAHSIAWIGIIYMFYTIINNQRIMSDNLNKIWRNRNEK